MPICRCVSGIVVEEGAATPQAGLRVRLVTEKGRGSVALAEATTDKGGRFSIEVSGLSADDTSGVLARSTSSRFLQAFTYFSAKFRELIPTLDNCCPDPAT